MLLGLLILMRSFYCILLYLFISCSVIAARRDSIPVKQPAQPAVGQADPEYIPFVDSVALAKANRRQFMTDSVVMLYLRPDSLRQDQFTSSILKDKLTGLTFAPLKIKEVLFKGKERNSRDPWIVEIIIALLFYTALLNLFLGNEMRSVLQAFYNRNALSQTEKESGLINSWAFIGLFILFSLSFGLLLYQLTAYYHVYYSVTGFRLFLVISLSIALLFILKFLVLKLIGFLFDAGSLVSEYIYILNLTYFTIAFLLLAVVICISLISERFVPLLLTVTLIITTVIFVWQYLRNSVGMAANFRFHKFYLFIYLCALEISPVLVLIKALSI